jgi:hypothetical protein
VGIGEKIKFQKKTEIRGKKTGKGRGENKVAKKTEIRAEKGLRKGKPRKSTSLPPKLMEKLVWVPVISFCKISFPVKHLMPYYAETDRSRPLNA